MLIGVVLAHERFTSLVDADTLAALPSTIRPDTRTVAALLVILATLPGGLVSSFADHPPAFVRRKSRRCATRPGECSHVGRQIVRAALVLSCHKPSFATSVCSQKWPLAPERRGVRRGRQSVNLHINDSGDCPVARLTYCRIDPPPMAPRPCCSQCPRWASKYVVSPARWRAPATG